MYMFVFKSTVIDSGNGLLTMRHQDILQSHNNSLWIGSLDTNAKWNVFMPFGLNVLPSSIIEFVIFSYMRNKHYRRVMRHFVHWVKYYYW